MFSPFAICKEILHRGSDVTPLKLIKLAYISHGFHLGYLGKPIFSDDVEAWPYGPVIRNIYFAVNHFKKGVITKELFDHIDDELDNNAERVIDAVINTYNKYSGLQLSTITHREGSPWDITVKKNGINSIIPDSLIQQHYADIIKANPR